LQQLADLQNENQSYLCLKMLLNCGARIDVRNADGNIPVEVATTTESKQILGVADETSGKCNGNVVPGTNFVPNYLQHPVMNYKVDITKKDTDHKLGTNQEFLKAKIKQEFGIDCFMPANGETAAITTPLTIASSVCSKTRIFKIRMAESNDPDFIEIDVPESNLNLPDLKEIMCHELEVKSPAIERIRKLPNTRLRRDIEVTRLVDYAELELVLLNSGQEARVKVEF